MPNQNHAGIHWLPHNVTKIDPRYLHQEMSYFDKIATIQLRPGTDSISAQARSHYMHKPYGKL